MAASAFPIKRIIGDFIDLFAPGSTGVRLKNLSGVAQFRDTADANFVDVAGKVIRVQGANATNYVGLQAPAALAGITTYTLPALFPSANGQFLSSTTGGVQSWVATPNANAMLSVQLAFTQATTTPAPFLTTVPANAYLSHAVLAVTAAATASGASVALGITGTTGAYVSATDEDLMQVSVVTIPIGILLGASPASIIATIVPNAQTFTGTLTLFYSNPAAAA